MAKVLIVGSNRGIGLELVRQFAARGDSVWAACRKASDSLKEVKNVTIVENIDIGKVKEFHHPSFPCRKLGRSC